MRSVRNLALLVVVTTTSVFGQQCGEGCEVAFDGCASLLDASPGGHESLFSCLKDQTCGPLKWSAGGQLRHRFMDERNRFRPGGAAQTEYNLWRFNPWFSFSINDTISGRIEGIDASAFGYDPPLFPVIIDVNRSDLLKAWIDIKLADVGADGSLRYRYGRQVLKYGSQHLLSPLAWSNTFRNFSGHKLIFRSGDWAIDGFHMDSVNATSGGSNSGFRSFDRPDRDRTISGIYASYSGIANQSLDLYWLYFDEDNDDPGLMDGERHTFGARLLGSKAVTECGETIGTWNWDLEGAYQTGTDDFGAARNLDVSAGFVSAIGGYQFNSVPWAPKVNGIFYWGSGDDDPTDGDLNTVFTLYPLGHAYWGIIDNFVGQNLIDAAVSVTAKPADKLTCVAVWHHFTLADDSDNYYNIAGVPFAVAGEDIGTELDLIATLAVSQELQVQAGYSWFWYGSGVNNSAFARDDARQFYLQTTWTF